MTSKAGAPGSHGQAALAEALISSGLIKNAKLADPQPVQDPTETGTIASVDRKAGKRRSMILFEQSHQRSQSQLRPSIEDIIIDRVSNPPLPRLRPESTIRDYGEAISDVSFLHDPPRKHTVPEATNEEVLSVMSGEQITFPKVMIGTQSLGKAQIASRANYNQLNNLLHTMTAVIDNNLDLTKDERIAEQKDAFDTVMSEMVRQGFYECSAKGELLEEMRSFMSDAAEQIPILQKRMAKQKEVAQQRISALSSENEQLTDNNQRLSDKNTQLERIYKDLQTRLHFLEAKIPALEEDNRNLRMMASDAESRLKDSENEVSDLKEVREKLKKDLETKVQLAENVSLELQNTKKALELEVEKLEYLQEKMISLNEHLKNVEMEKEKLIETVRVVTSKIPAVKPVDSSRATGRRLSAAKPPSGRQDLSANSTARSGKISSRAEPGMRVSVIQNAPAPRCEPVQAHSRPVVNQPVRNVQQVEYQKPVVQEQSSSVRSENLTKQSAPDETVTRPYRNYEYAQYQPSNSQSEYGKEETASRPRKDVVIVSATSVDREDDQRQSVRSAQKNEPSARSLPNDEPSSRSVLEQDYSSRSIHNKEQSARSEQSIHSLHEIEPSARSEHVYEKELSSRLEQKMEQSSRSLHNQEPSSRSELKGDLSSRSLHESSEQNTVQSVRSLHEEAQSVRSEQKTVQSVRSLHEEAQSVRSEQKSAQSIRSLHEQEPSARSEQKTVQSVRSLHEEAQSVRSEQKSEQSIRSLHEEAQSVHSEQKSAQSIRSLHEQEQSVRSEQKSAQSIRSLEQKPSVRSEQKENIAPRSLPEQGPVSVVQVDQPDSSASVKEQSARSIHEKQPTARSEHKTEYEREKSSRDPVVEFVESEPKASQRSLDQTSVSPEHVDPPVQSERREPSARSTYNNQPPEPQSIRPNTPVDKPSNTEPEPEPVTKEIRQDPARPVRRISLPKQFVPEAITRFENGTASYPPIDSLDGLSEIDKLCEMATRAAEEYVQDMPPISSQRIEMEVQEYTDDDGVVQQEYVPVVKDYVDQETQTKTFPKSVKRNRPKPQEQQPQAAPAPSRPNMSLKEIQDLKDDFAACNDILGDRKVSLDEFNSIKNIILARNGRFVPITENIVTAQHGEYTIDGSPEDQNRLFAQEIMVRVMDRSVRYVGKVTCECQTDSVPVPVKVTRETQARPVEFTKGEYGDAFTKLLDPSYSTRPPRTFEWMIKSLRSIFDEKTLKDTTDLHEGRLVIPMPKYTLEWASRQYGLAYLAHQCCWDLVNTCRAHKYKSTEIEMFRKFLDEEYSSQQLTFFLRTRAACLRRGITITVKSKESDEYYNDVVLTAAQGLDIIKKIFEKAGQDFVDLASRQVRESMVRKPSPALDPNVNYVSMIDLLSHAVEAFGKYESLELRKLMNYAQVAPRPDNKDFRRIMRELITNLTDQEIAEFHRIMMTQNSQRVSMSEHKFKKTFKGRSLLSKENTPDILTLDKIGRPSPELDAVREKWHQLQPILNDSLEKDGDAERNPSLAHAMQCLRMEMDGVSASLTCYDVIGVHKHMFACVNAYQSLLWTIEEPTAERMGEITSAIRDILQI